MSDAADYGHFAEGSSMHRDTGDPDAAMFQNGVNAGLPALPHARRFPAPHSANSQLTPSFFCRLDDEVVYWNTSRLSG